MPTTFAQNNEKSWDSVRVSAKSRDNAVKECFIQGSFSYFQSAPIRRLTYSRYAEQHEGGTSQVVADANSLTAFSWFTDRLKWRLDIRRVYPALGGDFKQIAFNGEKYITYDEGFVTGAIGAERLKSISPPAWANNDLTTFSADTIFGAGMCMDLEKRWIIGKEVPVYQSAEIVNGVQCDKYTYRREDTAKGNFISIDAWFSPEKKIFFRIKVTVAKITSKDQPIFTNYYVVQKTERFSGIDMPVNLKIEAYAAPLQNVKYGWLNTKVYIASKVQVNDADAVSAFGNPVRVTARIVDQLENPGVFQTLGGDLDEASQKVRLGTPPTLEEGDVTADGAAPEVEEAQAKLERKPDS